jgi:hypothetical protein
MTLQQYEGLNELGKSTLRNLLIIVMEYLNKFFVELHYSPGLNCVVTVRPFENEYLEIQ